MKVMRLLGIIMNVKLLGKCRWLPIIGKTNVQILRLLVGFVRKILNDIEPVFRPVLIGTSERVCPLSTQTWRHARSHDVTELEVDPAGNSVLQNLQGALWRPWILQKLSLWPGAVHLSDLFQISLRSPSDLHEISMRSPSDLHYAKCKSRIVL
jgi:hypothetical protein